MAERELGVSINSAALAAPVKIQRLRAAVESDLSGLPLKGDQPIFDVDSGGIFSVPQAADFPARLAS